ncbi:MAG: protein phosphatase 2C domain-containing protein, partial [Thermodesulfobacteriota bacterium]
MATGWKLDFGADQHQGTREEQEDFFASSRPSMDVVESDAGFLGLVADGMGGMAGGAQASLIAVNTFMEDYKAKSPAETIPEALNRALYQANAAVVEANRHVPEDQGSGTTILACVIQSSHLHWVSVGDSSLLLFRDGSLQAVNEDHSYGAELDAMLAAGEITPEQAQAEAGKRHGLTSYLGLDRIPKINLSRLPVELKTGDKVLLCSDGLLNALSTHEIAGVLGKAFSAQEKCELLIKAALAKRDPYQDNITVILLELNRDRAPAAGGPAPGLPGGRGKLLGVLAGLVVLAVAAGAAVFFWPQPDQPLTTTTASAPTTVATTPSTQSPAGSTSVSAATTTTTSSTTATTLEPQPEPGETTLISFDCNKVHCYQAVLKARERYDGDLDGIAGGGTREALIRYQRAEGLALTEDEFGEINPPTCKSLEEHYQAVAERLIESGGQKKTVAQWCALAEPLKPTPPARPPVVTRPKPAKKPTKPAEKPTP